MSASCTWSATPSFMLASRSFASLQAYTGPIAVDLGKFPHAGVAKLADAQDLKSWIAKAMCGFDSHPRHYRPTGAIRASVSRADLAFALLTAFQSLSTR